MTAKTVARDALDAVAFDGELGDAARHGKPEAGGIAAIRLDLRAQAGTAESPAAGAQRGEIARREQARRAREC